MIQIDNSTIRKEARHFFLNLKTRNWVHRILSLSRSLSIPHHSDQNGKITIIAYHRIDHHAEGYPIRNMHCVTPENFRKQILYLQRHFQVLSLTDMIQNGFSAKNHSNKVAITFDDGYRDNYLNAFPILKEYHLPAIVFLTTGYIGTTKRLWWNRVENMIALSKEKEIRLSYCGINITCNLIEQKDKIGLILTLIKTLKWMDNEPRERIILKLIKGLGLKEEMTNKDGILLNWNEIKKMHQEGMSFGSHTLSHPILSRISKGQVRKEIFSSRTMIEQNIQVVSDLFAYPNGYPEDFNMETVNILKEADFKCGLTMIAGVNTSNTDPFYLKRICITGYDSLNTFSYKLSGSEAVLSRFKKFTKRQKSSKRYKGDKIAMTGSL